MLHVAHLTSVHVADDIRIFHKECRALEQAGFRVTLIAPDKYIDKNVDYGDVELRSVPLRDHRFSRMTGTNLQVIREAIKAKADVYHIHDAELLPGLWALKAMGAKTVYDAHEDLPKAIMAKPWIPSPIRTLAAKLSGAVEDFSSHVLDGVVAATSSIGRRFPSKKTLVLQNYPIGNEFNTGHDQEQYLARPFAFIYAGLRKHGRGIPQMVESMHKVPRARFKLFGPKMSAQLQTDLRNSPGWAQVDDGGYISRDRLRKELSESRAGLLTLLPEPNHIESQPNKLFEYMSAGIPVIASDFPLWREIINGTGCGLLVDPEDPNAIAKAMNWILDNPIEAYEMGKRGAEAIEQRYNWNVESPKLVEFYQNLAA